MMMMMMQYAEEFEHPETSLEELGLGGLASILNDAAEGLLIVNVLTDVETVLRELLRNDLILDVFLLFV